MTDTTRAEPIGQGTTNTRPGSVVDVFTTIDESLLLFDPANEALVVVEREHARAFLEEANQLKSLTQRLIDAKARLLELGEQFDQEANQRMPSLGRLEVLKLDIHTARRHYEAAYADIKKELGDSGYLSGKGDGKELLELIPLARRKGEGKPREWGRKWTYVRSQKMKNHLRSYPLSKADLAGQKESFVRQGRVDTQQLRKQFGTLDTALKNEWFEAHEAGYLFPKLQSWAETLNQQASEAAPARFEPKISLFRYFAGCAASGQWKPSEGKIAGKLNGSAELMLAHGECETQGFAPNERGWALVMVGPKRGKEFHIGAIRLAGTLKVEAAVGASVAAELSLEVDYSALTGKPSVKGARRTKKGDSTPKQLRLDAVDAGASAGADLFAGIKVAVN